MFLKHAILIFFLKILFSSAKNTLDLCLVSDPFVLTADNKLGEIFCNTTVEKCCPTGCCPLIEKLNLDSNKTNLRNGFVTSKAKDISPRKEQSGREKPNFSFWENHFWISFSLAVIALVLMIIVADFICGSQFCSKKETGRSGPISNFTSVANDTQGEGETRIIELTEIPSEVYEIIPSAPPHPNISFELNRNEAPRNPLPLTPPPRYEDAIRSPLFRPEEKAPTYEDIQRSRIS